MELLRKIGLSLAGVDEKQVFATGGGRPRGAKNKRNPKRDAVLKWKATHQGTIRQCAADLCISKTTVCKYWKETEK